MEKSAATEVDDERLYQSHLRTKSWCSKPSWFSSSFNDIDERIKPLLLNSPDRKDQTQPDSFARRAELYYQERPQLLSLLHDLYNTYLSLSERHSQSLHKHHPQKHHLRVHSMSDNHSSVVSDCVSDAGSSLSFQSPSSQSNSDVIIAEIVIRNVEFDLMVHELGLRERQGHESSRKIELQRSLLDVLESERLILLNENTGLRYRVSGLIEENQVLISECLFMKRKASELARSVLKMRDDHRVFMLSRKIEDLQGKINSLEKRNHGYCDRPSRNSGAGTCDQVKCEDFEGVSTQSCSQEVKQRVGAKKNKIKLSKWWRKVMNLDLLFVCKPHSSESFGC